MMATERYMRIAAVFCVVLAVVVGGSVVVAMFNPPPWNRAERMLQAWAWFYVGLLHWRLADCAAKDGA